MKHPCFDGHENSAEVGRIHLPLINSCNIKCFYCNRKTNCSHENRPGVSTNVVSVNEALDTVAKLKNTNLKIIGIAGPGDPFSDPDKLFSFIEAAREKFRDAYELCLSSNGLTVYKHIELLKKYHVNYLTLTINAVDPLTCSEIVEWINDDGIIYKGIEAAERLLAAQFKSLQVLLESGIKVKVNTVIVPDVNQYEIPELLRTIKSYGNLKVNLIPLIPVRGTKFEKLNTISIKEFEMLFAEASGILEQIKHCKKCRADAMHVRAI